MIRHLEYVIDFVGIEHVGISTDFSFDYEDFVDETTRNQHLFGDSYTRWSVIEGCHPKHCWPSTSTSPRGAGPRTTSAPCWAATSIASRNAPGPPLARVLEEQVSVLEEDMR